MRTRYTNINRTGGAGVENNAVYIITCRDQLKNGWLVASSLHHILTHIEPLVWDGKRRVVPNLQQCAEAEVTSIWALILHQFHEIATFFVSIAHIQPDSPGTTNKHTHTHTFMSPQLLGTSRGLVAHTNGSYFRLD